MTQHQESPGGALTVPVRAGAAVGRPAVVNRGQLAAELGIEPWMVTRGQELGIVPERTTSKGWSRQVADALAGRVAELREAIAEREGLGARRIAEEVLAPATGLAVAADDVPKLAERGLLRVVGEYSGRPLYSVRDAKALTPAGKQALADIVGQRLEREARREAEWKAWCAVSLPPQQAAERIGWTQGELEKVARQGRIETGRGGRYPLAGLDALAADEELCERVAGDRLVRADEAAGLLEIRASDWKLVVTAGWIAPATVGEARVGRRRWIEVPYYRVRDVEALRELPGIDWEEVRASRPGAPSVLREFVARVPERAEAVHHFAAALADRHHVEVWAYFDDRTGGWELEWTRNEQGGPVAEDVAAELRSDPLAGRYRREIRLSRSRWGAQARWARPLTEDGAAVVLCTRAPMPAGSQTQAGRGRGDEEVLVEVAVVDAATADVLLDAGVQPTAAPCPGQDPAGGRGPAREWEKVLPRLRAVTRGRLIIPGDPTGDPARITAATTRAGKRLMHLSDAGSWALSDGDRPIAGRTAGLPAAEACAYVRAELLRLARGHGRHHQPQNGDTGTSPTAPSGTRAKMS
ncbi:hypothetical protein [Streptomyces nigrescens]|uniref:hypothetical protein n=1 Tax=Streptomyces nigrescens TaxID=1920 RepID=UPI0036FA70E5